MHASSSGYTTSVPEGCHLCIRAGGNCSSVASAGAHSGDQHSPALELDEEEHVQGLQPDRLDGEEVTGDDRGGLGADELAPGVPVWARTGLDGRDAADARGGDLDAELLELALDPLITPARLITFSLRQVP